MSARFGCCGWKGTVLLNWLGSVYQRVGSWARHLFSGYARGRRYDVALPGIKARRLRRRLLRSVLVRLRAGREQEEP